MRNINGFMAGLAAVVIVTLPSALAADKPDTAASNAPTASTPTAGDYTRGVKAWAENCQRCHNMRDPKEFSDDQWHVIVTHMRLRAGLTGQTTRDILTFLQRSN